MNNKGGQLAEFIVVWPLVAALLFGGLDLFRLSGQRIRLQFEAKRLARRLAQTDPVEKATWPVLGEAWLQKKFATAPQWDVVEKILVDEDKGWKISILTARLRQSPEFLFPLTRYFVGETVMVTGQGSSAWWRKNEEKK